MKNFNPENFEQFKISGFRDIRAISDSNGKERFFGVPYASDNLKNINIVHGDILIVRLTAHYEADNLYVWDTPNGRTAKFFRDNFDGSITLHNQDGWTQRWQKSEVKCFGVVVRVERDLEVKK